MTAKLPLDSPLWPQLSACWSAADAVEQLRELLTTQALGEPWQALRDEMLHQGSVYGVTSAAIPHLVDLAPDLPIEDRRELWTELGFLVNAGAGTFPSPPLPELQEGLTEALDRAGGLAVRDFLTDTTASPDAAGYFALACVTLAGHDAGRAMWEFPSPGYVQLQCAGCDAEDEVGGFADPVGPPCPPPVVDLPQAGQQPWPDLAEAVSRVRLGPGWDGFAEAARRVAAAGVPSTAPPEAVWCLVAAMVATKGDAALPWARTLARLAGHVRCTECGLVWRIADLIDASGDAEPVDPAGVPADTVADGVTGFRPAPGRDLSGGTLGVRVRWRAGGGPVDAVDALGTRMVLAAGPSGTSAWDPASGARVLPDLPGPAVAVSAAPGTVVATAAPDGSLRWWDAATGALTGHSQAAARVLGTVLLPDGRRELAAGDADGGVELWVPGAAERRVELFRRAGSPVVAMTGLDRPPGTEGNLVVVYGSTVVDVWSSAAVSGERSTMAPAADGVAAIGHEHLIGVAVPPRPLGHHAPMLLADRNGTVSMWEPFGVRLADPLPPDPGHRDVAGVAAVPLGDGVAVVTVSRTDGTLRVWDPVAGAAAVVPLGVRPRCVTAAGGVVVVGHDDGVLALDVTT